MRPAGTFFGGRALAFVLVAGLVLGIVNLCVIRSDSEIVKVYRSVFDALEAGQNPYTSGTIYHEIEGRGPRTGTSTTRPWRSIPTTWPTGSRGPGTSPSWPRPIILIQASSALLLFRMFPRIRPVLLLPFVPMIVLGEVKTTVALTLLVISSSSSGWSRRTRRGSSRPSHPDRGPVRARPDDQFWPCPSWPPTTGTASTRRTSAPWAGSASTWPCPWRRPPSSWPPSA